MSIDFKFLFYYHLSLYKNFNLSKLLKKKYYVHTHEKKKKR